uniref:alpha-soluble NSF attachment protein isoform X1 n=1 Tax=Halichoerus grypus TaxID=9711 RepID=UPI001659BFFF|nr:alpha-soluble NSF attachment protein isoform X1 [Halichoerus grypus]
MDNSGKEAEAMALLAEAERKVKNSQSFFSGLFGGSSKIEEACEIYTRAANMFKMAKNWSGLRGLSLRQLPPPSASTLWTFRSLSPGVRRPQVDRARPSRQHHHHHHHHPHPPEPAAGNAFCQAAQLHLQLQSKHDAATCFVDAGNAFKKADPQEAINCLMRAIEIYTDMGRFTIAAKHHISIAEIYETELVDIEKAIAHYEQSADYYKGEESNSSANKCLLKVAGYAAQLEQYQKAVDIYEQVGTNAMDSPLLKYSAKDYFFKAALCHFCIDMLNAKLAVQKYEELFPAFSGSRECTLMKKLLDAHEEQNIDSYTEAVKEYDAISRLDQWLTTMLLRIKKTIQGDEEDLR